MIPKLKFKPLSLEDNIELIKWAFFSDNDNLNIHDCTIDYFPELANVSREEIDNKIEEIVTREYKKYSNKIKNDIKRYNDIWKKYNDIYFKMLSTYFECDWHVEVIECTVGLIPIFPRYLNDFSFSIGIGIDEVNLVNIVSHETLHFMWFQKWEKIHPETPRIEYDAPYLVWKYSEMVTDPILNNKPFIDLFNGLFVEHGYDSFYDLYDGDNLVMDKLRAIYSKDIPIDDKINKGFDYIKKISVYH